MISISLSEKFCRQNLITSIKVIDMTGHSRKTNKLRNIKHHRMSNEEPSRNGRFTISKSKSSRLSKILVLKNPSDVHKCKSKNDASVSAMLALFN